MCRRAPLSPLPKAMSVNSLSPAKRSTKAEWYSQTCTQHMTAEFHFPTQKAQTRSLASEQSEEMTESCTESRTKKPSQQNTTRHKRRQWQTCVSKQITVQYAMKHKQLTTTDCASSRRLPRRRPKPWQTL